MEFFHKNQKMILVAILIFGGLYAYNTYFKSAAGSLPQDVSTTEVGREVLALYDSLQSVTLDQSLFTDPLYRRLVDFSVSIPPQVPGRQNPFAELGEN